MKRLTYFLFLIFLSIDCSNVCYGQNLRFEHLTTKDGLAGNIVWNIVQDPNGYMWFGTMNGLSRYDGYKFTNYTYRPHDTTSISQNTQFITYVDAEGAIWAGTTEGGICKFDPNTEQFTTYRPPQPKGLYVPALRAVSAINEDSEGMLWIANWGGEFWRFDKRKGKFLQQYYLDDEVRRKSLDQSNGINYIYKDRKGVMWISSAKGLYRLSIIPDKAKQASSIRFTHYLPDPQNPNNQVTSIFEDHQGFLWIGTNGNGLFRYDAKTGKFTKYLHQPNDPFSISNNEIFRQCISEDRQGNLWIGTFGGLNRLNPERTQFTRYLNNPLQTSSLGSNLIGSLFIDKAETLWIGTLKGISRWIPFQKPFNLFTHNPYDSNSLTAGEVSSICDDKDGTLWFGTETLNKYNKQTGTFTSYVPTKQNLEWGGIINALTIDRAGTFWVGIGTTLTRFNPKTGKFIISGSKTLDELIKKADRINTIYQDKDGLLWMGAGKGVLTYEPTTKSVKEYVHNPNNKNGISDYQANVFLEDSRGNIWIGHGSVALTRFNKSTGKFTWFVPNPRNNNSVSSNVIQSLYEDKKGNLWIGSKGGGLCRFDFKTEKFTTYAAKEGLTASEVFSILEDENSNLWLGTDKGIFSFSLKTHTFKRYDASDGLQSNVFSKAAWRGSDGTLYMGGSDGFNAFDPTQIKPNPAIPPVVITEFRLFDKPVLGKQEAKVIELNFDQNFFSFEFAALNFTNAHKNQYAYQLVGVDKDWVYSGTRRNVSYTDLPSGDYTFRVKASNNDGIWNEKGISIQVIISPPWWKTWWAYTLYGLLFVIGLWSFISYRSRALRRENRILEEKVSLRTTQLENKSHELEKSLSTLQSTQVQLIQKEKLASLGELTAGIAHEIQNPLNFVNNFSEVSSELVGEMNQELDKGDINEAKAISNDLKENLEKITLHGKRASSIVKGMLEHSRASTGEKELTDINALADEYLRLAYHGLRAKDNTFNSEFKTDFDSNLPKIAVIPQDIGRVLLNLINNAFYAVRNIEKPLVTLSTDKSDNQIIIKVKDNGSGMSQDVKAKIFQPFFTTKPTGQGTGLGLSLAYDIVTKGHRGTLECESVDGMGTEFIVKLPIN